jgi:hypothetical protein
VEQIVEKIVEKIVQVPVPVTRQEHVTRQVVQSCVQNTRAPPRQTDVKVVSGQDYGVTQGCVAGCGQPAPLGYGGVGPALPVVSGGFPAQFGYSGYGY